MSAGDAADSEILYHPSKWVKRLPVDVVVGEHIKWIKKVSDDVVSTIPYKTVRYDDGNKTQLDIFGTDLPDESLVFLYVHGGYWQEKSIGRENSSFIAKALHANKIKTVVVGYDLCPDVTLEQIVQQIRKAFKYCIDYCISHKSKGLLLAGHSAGAHLIATLFQNNNLHQQELSTTERNLVKAAFLIGGIYNLIPLVDIPSVNEPLKLTKPDAEQLSPLLQTINAANENFKFYIAVAENESPAFKQQARELAAKLRDQDGGGGRVEYVVVEDTDHFDIVEKLTDGDFQITKAILEFAD